MKSIDPFVEAHIESLSGSARLAAKLSWKSLLLKEAYSHLYKVRVVSTL